MPPVSLAAPFSPPRITDHIGDIPLPHRPDCGNAPLDGQTTRVVAQRLRSALDTADALHLGPADPIDLHVCELRQLARWHIVARPGADALYYRPWTIDDADPVFPVTVAELRWIIERLEAMPPAQTPPHRAAMAAPHRTFA